MLNKAPFFFCLIQGENPREENSKQPVVFLFEKLFMESFLMPLPLLIQGKDSCNYK